MQTYNSPRGKMNRFSYHDRTIESIKHMKKQQQQQQKELALETKRLHDSANSPPNSMTHFHTHHSA